MVLESTDEQLAVRFSPYVEELRTFFTGHSLPFGAPENIFAFSERLSVPGAFQGELSSLVRAVIYREQESISQGDLLGLLTLAVGGPEIDLTDPKFRDSVRLILAFLGGVLRSMWRVIPPPQPAAIKPEMEPPPTFAVEPPPSSHPVNRHDPPSRVIEEVQVRSETPWYEAYMVETAAQATPRPKQNLFARVRELWREPETEAQEDDAAYPQYQPVGLFKAKYRPFWLVGLCGVSIGLATGLMLRNRPPVPRPVVGTTAPQGFHPWFPPIPKPQAGETFQAAEVPLPPIPLPSPSSTNHSLGRAPVHARALDEAPGSAITASHEDQALAERFFPRTPGPGQSSSRSSIPYTATTGQSHPTASVPTPSAVPGARLRSEYAELAPPSPYDGSALRPARPGGAFRARELPRTSVFLSASGAMAANLISAPAPAYPALASSSRVQGKVVVQAVVGTDGRVIGTRVLSGPEFLRSAALDAVRRWRYRPYLVDGRPSIVATNAILNFQLAP